jgi:hypothetical protein
VWGVERKRPIAIHPLTGKALSSYTPACKSNARPDMFYSMKERYNEALKSIHVHTS